MFSRKLFIGGEEVLRINKDGNSVQYLICDDDVAMKKVSAERFGEFMKSLENVCEHSWNKNLYVEYKEIERLYNSVNENM